VSDVPSCHFNDKYMEELLVLLSAVSKFPTLST